MPTTVPPVTIEPRYLELALRTESYIGLVTLFDPRAKSIRVFVGVFPPTEAAGVERDLLRVCREQL